MSTDPVCGMTVDEGRAAYVSVQGGRRFYFCSQGCKTAFDRNPQKYVRAT